MVRVVLVGGGTAGHTSPMIATAEAIKSAAPDARLLCVGTAKGLETTVVPQAGLDLRLIPPVPLPRSLTPALLRVPDRLFRAVRAASAILKEFSADVVVGFGGYVSLPVYLAAWRRHIPVVVQEQNVLPGLANKIAARFATAVLTSFPSTPLKGAQFAGLPVRAAITELSRRGRSTDRLEARRQFGLPDDGRVLLVSGGSQGAQRLNDAVVGARQRLLAAGVSVLHVFGGDKYPVDAEIVEGAGGARYIPWRYVQEMAEAYSAADLMLARAGANTVTETGSVGLPCIFVPYPYSNGEQRRNAEPLVDAGAGVMVEDDQLTAESVLSLALPLLDDPAKLDVMGRSASAVMRPGSADRVAAVVLSAGGGRDHV